MAIGLKTLAARVLGIDPLRLIIGAATVGALLIYAVSFQVHEGEAVVVVRMGKPVRVADSAGLHFKAPWPVAAAIALDTRQRIVTTPQTELLTRDKKNIVLTTSATWRVVDPVQFLRSVRSIQSADDKLQGLITNANIATFGRYDLSALVSTDPGTLSIDAIEADVLQAVNAVAILRYGVRVQTLGFRRVSLPEQNIPFVLEQMRAERRQFAAQFRAEGALEAARIRNAADLEAARLIAQAEEEATRIRGKAEAEAAQIYARAHAAAPEFYAFIRAIESLQHVVGENARLTLRTDVAPLSLLKSAPDMARSGAGPLERRLTKLLEVAP